MVQSGTLSSAPHMLVIIPAPAPHGCSRQVSEDSPWYIPAAGGRVARCGAPCAAQAAPRRPLTESWLVTAGAQSLVRSLGRGSHQPRPRHMSPCTRLSALGKLSLRTSELWRNIADNAEIVTSLRQGGVQYLLCHQPIGHPQWLVITLHTRARGHSHKWWSGELGSSILRVPWLIYCNHYNMK